MRQPYTTTDFAHLAFLAGRWEGTAPDGSSFYEQYVMVSETEMRTTRFADASFASATDGSVITLKDGRVISTWQAFTWEATELAPGRAAFAPLNAPSSFSWELTSTTTIQVTQRWSDENGTAQSYVVPLKKL